MPVKKKKQSNNEERQQEANHLNRQTKSTLNSTLQLKYEI
jgi:hypothetical protein